MRVMGYAYEAIFSNYYKGKIGLTGVINNYKSMLWWSRISYAVDARVTIWECVESWLKIWYHSSSHSISMGKIATFFFSFSNIIATHLISKRWNLIMGTHGTLLIQLFRIYMKAFIFMDAPFYQLSANDFIYSCETVASDVPSCFVHSWSDLYLEFDSLKR